MTSTSSYRVAPHQPSVLLPTGHAVAVGGSVHRALPTLLPSLYAGTAADPLFSAAKGQITERMMSRAVLRGFLEDTGKWVSCTPRLAPQGFDGLYVRMNGRGRVTDLLVSEAKYGSATLGTTASGRQMSSSWIRHRLRNTAALYGQIADRAGAGIRFSSRPPTGIKSVLVPLEEGRAATVWEDSRGRLRAFSSHPTSHKQIGRGARAVSSHMRRASDGEVPYRSRLFRQKSSGNRIRFQMDELDASGRSTGRSFRVQGRFDELKSPFKKAYLRALEKAFLERGHDPVEARALAAKAARDPEFLRTLRDRPSWQPSLGFDRRGLMVAGGAAGLAFLGDVFAELIRSGQPDWKRAAQRGVAVGVSSGVGYVSGVQIHGFLVGTEVGRNLMSVLPPTIGGRSTAALASSASAGVIALVVQIALLHQMGLLDKRQASRMLATSATGASAAAVASAATMATVAAYGTAGTGVAITSLSGAAATNASLAVLGGGTVAAGGGGMATGVMILSGGTAAVAIAATGALHLAFKALDDREQRTLIEGRMRLVTDRLDQGLQPEWV